MRVQGAARANLAERAAVDAPFQDPPLGFFGSSVTKSAGRWMLEHSVGEVAHEGHERRSRMETASAALVALTSSS